MADVVITGGAGFLGARLARELLAVGSLDVAGSGARPLSRLTLIDLAPLPADLAADGRVAGVRGDLGEPAGLTGAARDAVTGADVIFHLAAAVSGECEADFDLGLRANLQATEALLALGRAAGTSPVVVFSSSAAVFGDSADHPLPAVVDDHTLPNPQTSYGVQKVIGEQLLADYTRKGFVRGRAIRLMTVCVRPGRPNAAASGFFSSIIRGRWPGGARSARSTRGPRWRSPHRRRPSAGCSAPPPPPRRPGEAAARSTSRRSPSRSQTWSPRWSGRPGRRPAG